MKTAVATLLPLVFCMMVPVAASSCRNAAQQSTFERRVGFKALQTVSATGEVADICSSVIPKLTLSRAVSKWNPEQPPCQTLDEATQLIWHNVSMAYPPSHCTEFQGWYFFPMGDGATPDGGKFSFGMAVKKGTAEIYSWK